MSDDRRVLGGQSTRVLGRGLVAVGAPPDNTSSSGVKVLEVAGALPNEVQCVGVAAGEVAFAEGESQGGDERRQFLAEQPYPSVGVVVGRHDKSLTNSATAGQKDQADA
jgi:hypothetical protein